MPTLWQRLVDAGIALLFGEADPEVPSKPKPKPGPKPAERTVHRVRQTYRTSCGVAATAMLARVSHNRAKAVLFPKGSVKGRYNTTAKQVMRALDHFQVPHGVRELDVQHYEDIPTSALVTVRWFEGDKPNYHWLILQRKSAQSWILLDPGAESPETLRLGPEKCAFYEPVSYFWVKPLGPGDQASKKAPAKKTPAKKAPAKKTPAKKIPAKKTPAKKRVRATRKVA